MLASQPMGYPVAEIRRAVISPSYLRFTRDRAHGFMALPN
jgi:hypothetical protein